MSKHTPGPWSVRQDAANRWRIEKRKEGYVPLCLAIVTTTVCEVGCDPDSAEANARLIAAAPEMVEALRQISEGRGRFSLDQLEFAKNTIADMKQIAAGCLARIDGKDPDHE